MKITQAHPPRVFAPVTIVLETQEEVHNLVSAIANARRHVFPDLPAKEVLVLQANLTTALRGDLKS